MLLLLYITIVAYTITPYISYEDPVQLATTTNTDNMVNTATPVIVDPYHISRDEVCTLITTCLNSNRYLS